MAASTQGLAKSALLFLYQKVLGRELSYLDAVPANKPECLPVVFSREEVRALLPLSTNLKRLMFLVMYGAGLRHLEWRRFDQAEGEIDSRAAVRGKSGRCVRRP
ncbi:MAG: hypothetical protein RIK87_05745 [Fuerstiella sp.]